MASGFFWLRTWMGTRVGAINGQVRHYDHVAMSAEHADLIVYIPRHRPRVAFVFLDRPDRPPVSIVGDAWSAAIGAVRMQAIPGTADVALLSPSTGLYLCASPAAPGDFGTVSMDRPAQGAWEVFRLDPIPDPQRLIDQRPDVAPADPFAAEASTVDGFIRLLWSLTDGGYGALLDAVGRLLPADQLAVLGRALVSKPDLAMRMIAMKAGDFWLTNALPALALVVNEGARTTPPVCLIPAQEDFLAFVGADGTPVSLGHAITTSVRRSVVPRHALCVLATAANNGPYLLEWIAHHQAVGVEHFFVYPHRIDDGSAGLLDALAQAGFLTVLYNQHGPDISPTAKAYGHALQVLPDILAYRWAAVIDVDDFLCFDPASFASMPDYLAWIEARPTDAVALCQAHFGSAGQDRWIDAPMSRRLRRREAKVSHQVKSLCRPHLFMRVAARAPIVAAADADRFRLAHGDAHKPPAGGSSYDVAAGPTDDVAWINHYGFKSATEFLLRHAFDAAPLSPDVLTTTAIQSFLDQHQGANQINEDRITQCSPDLDHRIATLMALPGVRAARDAMQDIYRRRAGELLGQMRADPRFGVPGTPEHGFMRLVCD